MRTFILRKLVRDKIIDDMQGLGHTVESRTLEPTEYIYELNKKLLEEAHEAQVTDSTEALKELADVLEVVESLARVHGSSFEKLRVIQKERAKRRGSFHKRLYIEKATMTDTDKWATYYAAEPLKYPETDIPAASQPSGDPK